MPEETRAQYLEALLSQRKRNEAQGSNIVNQGGSDEPSVSATAASASNEDNKNTWQKIVGGVQSFGGEVTKGIIGFFENFADLGAMAIGGIGDATGWYDSKPFTNWAQHDLASDYVDWMKTYDISATSLVKRWRSGDLTNWNYWGDMFSDLGNVFTGQNEEEFDRHISEHYAYSQDNFMTNNEAGQYVGSIARSIGQMLPSIGFGKMASAAGASDKAAKALGTGLMSVSAAGSGAVEAFEDGATTGQALGYGALSGAIEFGTEYIPWEKIPGVGKLLGDNVLPGVGLRKFSISQLTKTMVQEGLEEVVSDMLNPIAKALTYKGMDALSEYSDPNFYLDVAKSFASGAITGGIMEGANMGANQMRYGSEGVDYINGMTEYYQDYYKIMKEYEGIESDYAKNKIGSEEAYDRAQDVAKKLVEIDEKGQKVSELWDKIPEEKQKNVAELITDPTKWAEFSKDSQKAVGDRVNELASKSALARNGVTDANNAVTFGSQSLQNGIFEQTKLAAYNDAYENDFARLQEESRGLLEELESSDVTHRELDDGVRERYTRGIQEKLEREIHSNPDVHESTLRSESKGTEFKIYSNVSGGLFHDAFEIIKPYVAQNELVDLHDSYEGAKCFLSSDGLQGFSIDGDGNLISVFNADTSKRGYVDAIKDYVRENGATHLDCYGYLANLYADKFGFKIASEMDYNMEYDHHGIAERYGSPEVSFLVKTDADIEIKHFTKDQYDEAKAYQMSFIDDTNQKSVDSEKLANKIVLMRDGTQTNMKDVLNSLKAQSLSENVEIKSDDRGKYVSFKGAGLSEISPNYHREIISKYLTDMFSGMEFNIDGDTITINKQGIKKMSKFSKNNVDKAYMVLNSLIENAKLESESSNVKNKQSNAPKYKYFSTRLECDGKMETFRLVTKGNTDTNWKYSLYSVQNENLSLSHNGTVQRANQSNGTGNALAEDYTNNVNKKTENVKSGANEAKTPTEKILTPEERKKAYNKAEATYKSNQQLLKDAAPKNTVDLKTARNYASAEVDLMTAYLNNNLDPDLAIQMGSNETMGKRYSAAVDTALDKATALATLDKQFDEALDKAKVKIGDEKAQKLTDYVPTETISELKSIAHQLHEQMVGDSKASKIDQLKTKYDSKMDALKDRLSKTVEMAKEVDRFNKNAEITKRQYKIDQAKYPEEFKADGTIRDLARSMPRYNALLKSGKRAADNGGLSLQKSAYENWAKTSYDTVSKLYNEGHLLNFDQAKADELFDAYETVMNGGDPNSKSLTVEQVKAMTRITKLLRFQISEQASEQRVEIRESATRKNAELSYRFEASPRTKSALGKLIGTAGYEQVKMMDLGDMISGYSGSELQKSMDSLNSAKSDYYDEYYGIKETYLDTKEMRSLMKESKGKVNFDGSKYSKALLLDAYLMLSDPETKALMDSGGGKLTRKIILDSGKNVSIKYDSGTYARLESALGADLTSKAKKILIADYYNDHSKNSYITKLRNFQLDNYGDSTISDIDQSHYPRSQSSDATTKVNSVDAMKSNGGKSTATNGSVTKARQSAQSIVSLEAMDPFARADSYARQVSNELHLRLPSNEFLRELGINVTGTDGKPTKLQMTLGDQLTGYLRDYVSTINDIELVSTDGLISTVQGGIVSATLGFSPINPMKNFLSIFKEGHEVGMANVAKVVLNPIKWVNGDLYSKVMGTGVWKARYADGTLSMQANMEVKGKWAKTMSKFTYLYTLADQATTLLEAQIDYQYVKKANPGLSKAELVDKAVELWKRNVNRTQSTAEKSGKSLSSSGRILGKDSQIVKASWTFQSDVVTGASMLVSDMSMLNTSSKIIKWANGVIAQQGTGSVTSEKVAYAKSMLSKAKATRTAILKKRIPAGVAAALVGALLKYMIESLNSRLKGKTAWDESLFNGDTIKELASNTAGSVIPFFDTISSALEYNDGQPELFGLSAITDTLQAMSELMSGKTRTGVIDMTKAVTSYIGIPVKNIYDYTIGMMSNFDPSLAVESKNLLYQSEKAQTTYSRNFDSALYERVGETTSDAKDEMKTLTSAGFDAKPQGVYDTYKNAKGEEVTISWSDKQTMKRYYQKANARLDRMMRSSSYRQLDDESKAKAIKKLYSAYRDASLSKVVTKDTPTSLATALAYADYKDLGKLLTASIYISSLEATKTATRKERALAYVNSLEGLTKAQRMVILKMAGYTVDSSYVKTVLKQAGLSNDAIKKIAS